MRGQQSLFPGLRSRPERPIPPGFCYRQNVITEIEEAALLASLEKLELKPFEFHGHLGNRRVASFGLRYDFSRRSVERASDIPAFLGDLLVRVAKFAGYETESFRQVGVNEYRPGAGIGWHKDKSQFGIIVGVSLLAPATMRFRRAEGDNWIRVA